MIIFQSISFIACHFTFVKFSYATEEIDWRIQNTKSNIGKMLRPALSYFQKKKGLHLIALKGIERIFIVAWM